MGESGGSTSRGRFRVLIAGGGVAALEAALALRELAEERVELEFVSPEPHFWYRPLAVLEPFGRGQIQRLELGRFAADCGARALLGALASVDADAHAARTAAGTAIEYDVLLIATGARPVAAVAGAITFRGPADVPALTGVLGELGAAVHRLVFAVPGGIAWPLPVYELALLTAAYAHERQLEVEITLVTHEEEPLALFGEEATRTVTELLEERGIEVRLAAYAREFHDGRLDLVAGEPVAADRVVALPRLEGVPIEGIPHDAQGFVPTDTFGRVDALADCFAAGDATSFPVKQGGLAAQQAEAAATAIAAAAGAPVEPEPFRPVLRGLLVTGDVPRFLRYELTSPGRPGEVDELELWWPPSKIVGRYLGPYLASLHGELVHA
jgi:sulfide:quinone oxidoreductase